MTQIAGTNFNNIFKNMSTPIANLNIRIIMPSKNTEANCIKKPQSKNPVK